MAISLGWHHGLLSTRCRCKQSQTKINTGESRSHIFKKIISLNYLDVISRAYNLERDQRDYRHGPKLPFSR